MPYSAGMTGHARAKGIERSTNVAFTVPVTFPGYSMAKTRKEVDDMMNGRSRIGNTGSGGFPRSLWGSSAESSLS
jgi:hypothetical protein